MLAIDDEQSGGNDDRRAGEHGRAWPGPEDGEADDQCPQHRGVLEGCDERGITETIALREEHLADAAANPRNDQIERIEATGQYPAERCCGEREESRKAREINHNCCRWL